MLRTRVITAVIMTPAILAALLFLPPWGFSALMAGLFALGAWEYSKLCGFRRASSATLYTVLQIGLLLLLAWGFYKQDWFEASDAQWWALALFVANWLLAFLRFGFGPHQGPAPISLLALNIIQSILMISGVWFALTWLGFLEQGRWWILMMFLTIWAADMGAYFSGRFFGKHKLAPRISPGKTIEGVVGAVIFATLVAIALNRITPLPALNLSQLIPLAVVTVLVSIGGDLFVSLVKRTAGVKDTGNIFPGHGGVLDRFDSIHSGAPFFALALFYFI